jgi:hypothetical protein
MDILPTECRGQSVYVITPDSLHLLVSVSGDRYKFCKIGTEFLCLIWTKCLLQVGMLTPPPPPVQGKIMLLPLWTQLGTPVQEQ